MDRAELICKAAAGEGSVLCENRCWLSLDQLLLRSPHREAAVRQGTVRLALWDKSTGTARRLCSGFVADPAHGLLVTAAHLIHAPPDPNKGRSDWLEFNGLDPGSISVLVAVFVGLEAPTEWRFVAEVAQLGSPREDSFVDACVLRVTHEFANPWSASRGDGSSPVITPRDVLEGAQRPLTGPLPLPCLPVRPRAGRLTEWRAVGGL